MSINARVVKVIRNHDGSGSLVLDDRPGSLITGGQPRLAFVDSPQIIRDLEGKDILGIDGSIFLGEHQIALRAGFGRIVFVESQQIAKALLDSRPPNAVRAEIGLPPIPSMSVEHFKNVVRDDKGQVIGIVNDPPPITVDIPAANPVPSKPSLLTNAEILENARRLASAPAATPEHAALSQLVGAMVQMVENAEAKAVDASHVANGESQKRSDRDRESDRLRLELAAVTDELNKTKEAAAHFLYLESLQGRHRNNYRQAADHFNEIAAEALDDVHELSCRLRNALRSPNDPPF